VVGRPEIVFVDEPTAGMDPLARRTTWELLDELRRDGVTVVLTTHYMDEADAMAERVVVVDHGRIIADDTPDRLKADLAGDRVVLTSPSPERLAALTRRGAGAGIGPREVGVQGRSVEVRVPDGPRALPVLVAAAQAEGVPVDTAQAHRPTLDDVFLALTGRSLRETATSERSAA